MKKEFVLGLVFVLFGFSLVAGAACSDPSQTIMKLSSTTNAHGALWNDSVYSEDICFNSIFGYDYSGANPHDCTGSNKVLSLSDVTNAHGASDGSYSEDVCYGNLECSYVAPGTCTGTVIGSMSGTTNAHLASDESYSNVICCASVGVYWADMNGDGISSADFGDSVQLIAKGFSSGTFYIKERDPISDDDIRSIVGVSDGHGSLVAVWNIAAEDMAETESGDYDNFYFVLDTETSEELAIGINGDDDPMDVRFVSPSCADYFNKSDVVNVNIVASDEDDLITGSVSIDSVEVATFSNGGISFDRIFDSPGNIQIMVVSSNTRGERSRIISNIMVLDVTPAGAYVDGEYVAACIDEPKDYANIVGSTVKFNASSTLGLSVSGGSLTELKTGSHPFDWYWTFIDANGGLTTKSFIDDSSSDAYIFPKEFPVAGQNSASLSVEV